MSAGSRFVVVTGCTKGIGRALAVELARLDHRVAGCGRTGAALESLRRSLGDAHDFALVDVSVDHEVRSWAERLIGRWGAPDLLVNNAALISRSAPLWKVPPEDFDRVIDVNIKGIANVLRHFVPSMIEAKKGVIVNLSSGWGRSTSPEVAPYCATKYAVEGLTKALAQELPEGLAAIPLSPGVIDTDMLRSCYGAEASRYPKPEAWAKVAAPFLLSLGPKDSGKSLTVPGIPEG